LLQEICEKNKQKECKFEWLHNMSTQFMECSKLGTSLINFVPNIISVHAVLSASPANLNCFLQEMMAVMDTSSHIPQSSPDDEQPSYAVHLSGSRAVTTEGLDIDTRMMCAKTVFTLIDFLWRSMREWISVHYLSSQSREDPVYVTLKGVLSLRVFFSFGIEKF
jgi:hypothetical protein